MKIHISNAVKMIYDARAVEVDEDYLCYHGIEDEDDDDIFLTVCRGDRDSNEEVKFSSEQNKNVEIASDQFILVATNGNKYKIKPLSGRDLSK